MAALLIKSMPPAIHQRLRFQAERHHRSMNREVLAILADVLDVAPLPDVDAPVKPLRPIRGETVVRMIRRMRDQAT